MKLLIIILSFFTSTFLLAQTEIEEITNVFNSYRSLINQKEYDEAFSLCPEDFLQYMPIENLKKQFTYFDENENFDFSTDGSEIIFISEILSNDSMKCAFIRYKTYYYYKFKKEANKEEIERLREILRKNNGKDYSYIKSERKAVIYKEQELIAIKKDQWKFIPYQKILNPYMSIWIPEVFFSELLQIMVDNK